MSPPIALYTAKVRYGIRAVPASAGIMARSTAVNLPTSTATAPREFSAAAALSTVPDTRRRKREPTTRPPIRLPTS